MKQILADIRTFNESRRWRKFHDPRSLILALCGEVGELAQIFRWRRRTAKQLSQSIKATVESEIADIFIFLFSLCIELNLDPEKVVRAKLKENEERFPVSHGAPKSDERKKYARNNLQS
jgi:dCTP diphosphatase